MTSSSFPDGNLLPDSSVKGFRFDEPELFFVDSETDADTELDRDLGDDALVDQVELRELLDQKLSTDQPNFLLPARETFTSADNFQLSTDECRS